MDIRVRPGRPDDVEPIRSFTAATFEWGDYVADRYGDWLDDDRSFVVVAAGPDDRPVAVARAVLVSDAEAWFHAARVAPDWRRRGIGSMLGDHLVSWARGRGARIARLLVEDWNVAAIAQVTKHGWRPVARFAHLTQELGSEPQPTSNGGRRVPGPERLVPAPAAEAEPAWMVWSTSGAAAAAHQLYPVDWVFRTMRVDHVRAAATRHELWQAPSGWVIGTSAEDRWHISWIATTEVDARRLVRAVVDRATDLDAQRITMLLPRWEPLMDAAAELGFTATPSTVYALGLTE